MNDEKKQLTTKQEKLVHCIRSLEAEGKMYKFYKSKAFLKLRQKVIKQAHGECQECLKKKPKQITRGTVVHHIKHVEEYPELALDISNLELVCAKCHWELHPEKHAKELKAQGRKRKEQVTKERW